MMYENQATVLQRRDGYFIVFPFLQTGNKFWVLCQDADGKFSCHVDDLAGSLLPPTDVAINFTAKLGISAELVEDWDEEAARWRRQQQAERPPLKYLSEGYEGEYIKITHVLYNKEVEWFSSSGRERRLEPHYEYKVTRCGGAHNGELLATGNGRGGALPEAIRLARKLGAPLCRSQINAPPLARGDVPSDVELLWLAGRAAGGSGIKETER